jgi:hypothetical protein
MNTIIPDFNHSSARSKDMHVEDKIMATNLGKTVMVLVGIMFALIILANLII